MTKPKSQAAKAKAPPRRQPKKSTTRRAKTMIPADETVPEAPKPDPKVAAFKGFDKNLSCRGFKYEVGQTFEHKGPVVACSSGFHACENPFDILGYYGFVGADGSLNRFGEVEQSGSIQRHGPDSKIVSAKITITAELSLPQFITKGIAWLIDKTITNAPKIDANALPSNLPSSDQNGARIGSSGYGARIGSSGYDAQIGSSGNGARIGSSGNGARIGSSGYGARIGSSGYDAQIGSSGNDARIGSSGYGARIGSSGYDARIGSSGNDARIDATGENAVVACAGSVLRCRLGPNGCAALPYHDGTRARFVTLYVGEGGIEAGKTYRLDDDGKPVEVSE